MIGGNVPCEGFNASQGFLSSVAGLISLQAKLFSQMRNLVSSYKILVCENVGRCLVRK